MLLNIDYSDIYISESVSELILTNKIFINGYETAFNEKFDYEKSKKRESEKGAIWLLLSVLENINGLYNYEYDENRMIDVIWVGKINKIEISNGVKTYKIF